MRPPLPTFPPRPAHRTAGALPLLSLCAVLFVAVTLGHEGRRVVQLAAANTTPRQTSEYLTMYGGALLPWAALALVAGAVLAVCVGRGRRAPAGDAVPPPQRPGRRRMLVAGLAGAAAISAAAYASKPWRRLHVGIEQAHARLADEVEMNNRTPGRSSVSLDQEVLDCVHEALQEPDARKLLIVHLMGAHPHYSRRFPEGANPFDDAPDAVGAAMGDSGRPAWLRRRRHAYDAAVLYQDLIVAEILKMARGIGIDDGHRAFMYLSDHGQEVGHGADRAGHSTATAAGYRIPLVVWQNRPPLSPPTDLGQRPFRADWAAWTVSHLLDIRWAGYRPERDVLHAAYRWQAPDIPVPPGAFVQ